MQYLMSLPEATSKARMVDAYIVEKINLSVNTDASNEELTSRFSHPLQYICILAYTYPAICMRKRLFHTYIQVLKLSSRHTNNVLGTN